MSVSLAPPKALTDKAEEVMVNMQSIRQRCEDLLAKNIDIIKSSNQGNFAARFQDERLLIEMRSGPKK